MRAASWCRAACGAVSLQSTVKALELDEHSPHAQDRVDPEIGSRSVCRAPRGLHLETDEALVRDADGKVGRLGDDRRVRMPLAFQQRARADPAGLFVGDGRHDHVTAQSLDGGSRRHRRGQPALHVIRAATDQSPVVHPRRVRLSHPAGPDRVEMTREQQRTAAASPAGDAHDHRPPRLNLAHADLQFAATHPIRHEPSNSRLAGAACDQRRVRRVDGHQRYDEILERGVGRGSCRTRDSPPRARHQHVRALGAGLARTWSAHPAHDLKHIELPPARSGARCLPAEKHGDNR